VLAMTSIILVISAVSCKTKTTTAVSPPPAGGMTVTNAPSGKTNSAAAKPTKMEYYTCAMHPEIHSQDPDGKCPICEMPLVLVEQVLVEPTKK
jgi:hypothetical protein